MRQGQNNKYRSRGRGGSNRGGGGSGGGGGGGRQSNPLNRVYESNGPDVKVRGNAQTIAEKYLQLARDAVSSGENVNRENYYQHAEHYLRIVASPQAASQQANQERQSQQNHQSQDDGDESDNDADVASSSAQSDDAADTADTSEGDNNARNNRNEGRNNGRHRNQDSRGRGGDHVSVGGNANNARHNDGSEDENNADQDNGWQSQAPDFLMRETPEVSVDAVEAEDKPKRQARPRKRKPVAVDAVGEDAGADAGEPAEDASAA